MMIVCGINNINKEFTYIGRLIEYDAVSSYPGYIATKWEDLLGKPHLDMNGNLLAFKNMVQEDREWIKDVFESLVVSSMWRWE